MQEIMSTNLEDRLIFYTSPGKLSRISSFKLALFCWQQHLKNYCSSSHFVEVKPIIGVSDILKVSLPKRITELIDRYIDVLRHKLYHWSEYHSSHVFGISHYNNVIFNYLDCVVLKPTGSNICFKSTAMNLMSNDRFSIEEKYSIACAYCFTEYIENFWLLTSDTPRLSTRAVKYWNEVRKFENNKDIGVNFRNWIILHYWYWPTLIVNRSTTYSASISENLIMSTIHVNNEISLDTVVFLLSNLDTTRQNKLIRKFTVKLIGVLALHDEEPSIRTLQLWHHVKNYVTEDIFLDLIQRLCEVAFIFRYIGSRSAVLLDEIWITASNQQRTDFVNYRLLSQLIMQPLHYNDEYMNNYGRSMAFYLHVFGYLSFENRNELWHTYWQSFAKIARVSDLRSLMSLCLGAADEVEEFIKNHMVNYSELKIQWRRLVLSGKYRELTEYMTYFYPDEKSVRETQQKILNSLLQDDLLLLITTSPYSQDYAMIHRCRFNLYSNQCIKFNDFVDNAFSAEDAQQFKNDFILHYVELQKNYLDDYSTFEQIRDMAKAFFSNDLRCLIEMKLKIYELCRSFSVVEPGTELYVRLIREWREFFKWCDFEKTPVLIVETNVAGCSGMLGKCEESQTSRKVNRFKNFFFKATRYFFKPLSKSKSVKN